MNIMNSSINFVLTVTDIDYFSPDARINDRAATNTIKENNFPFRGFLVFL